MFPETLRWTEKPPPGTRLDGTHPFCPDYCWPLLGPTNFMQCLTRRGYVPYTTNRVFDSTQTFVPGRKYGLSVRHNATTDHLNLIDDPVIVDKVVGLSGGHTMLVAYRKTDATQRQSTVIGVNGALSGGDIYYLIAPFNDNKIYWRYGGAVEGVTQVSMSAASVIFGDDLWVASTGPRGMELFQNGRLLMSNSGNPSRTASASYLGLPAGTPAWADLADTALIMTWNRQLPMGAIRDLSQNPWQVFESRLGMRFINDSASAPLSAFAALNLAP